MKQMILNLKNFIKELNVEQKADKLQRKTVNVPEGFVRTKSSWEATSDVLDRKEKLRMLYRVYELWREKETSADPNFEQWLHGMWGREGRFKNLQSEIWDRFAKSTKEEA